jgi:hypothetical protein
MNSGKRILLLLLLACVVFVAVGQEKDGATQKLIS